MRHRNISKSISSFVGAYPLVGGLAVLLVLATGWGAGARSVNATGGQEEARKTPSTLAAALEIKQQQAVLLTRSETANQRFQALAAKVIENGTVPVIVRVRAPFSPQSDIAGGIEMQAQKSYIATAQSQLIRELAGYDPFSVKPFEHLPFLAVRVNSTGLESLRASTNVLDIQEDKILRHALAQSVPLIGAPNAWTAGYTGAGQTVAILDTGVDKTHPFLSGKVVSEACYSTNYAAEQATSLCPGGAASATGLNTGLACGVLNADCEHGTHVAGIAAGSGTNFSGVAKDASLISIQVYSQFTGQANCGRGVTACIGSYDSDLIKGLERVYNLRSDFAIASVNMSLGGGKYTSNCDSSEAATKAAIDLLRGAGIASVVASGNEYYTNALDSPACISTAISVGSTTDMPGQADQISSFSNSASFLNLLAPGEMITSSVTGGGYDTWAGTSMATPHVAGAWAIARQKFPTGSVTDILAAFVSTGVQIVDTRNNISKPRIKVDAAIGAVGTSDPTPTIPTAPSALVATTASTTQINLSWQDNSNNESGFRIRRKTGATGTWSIIASVGDNATTFQNTGLRAGQTYYYSIAAWNSGGESSLTNEAIATTPISGPAPPSNLTATAASSTQINLSWQDNSTNETSFRIRRKIGTAGSYALIAVVGQGVTSFQNTGLTSGQTYFYTVSAANSTGESAVSNEASATTGAIPTAPSSLTATAVSSTQINLSWRDNSTNETGFVVRRKSGSGSWATVGSVGAGVAVYQDTGLSSGTSYTYTVAATGAAGESTTSNEATATTSAALPTAPSGLTATTISSTQIGLSWQDNSNNETGFRVRRKAGSGGTWAVVATVGSGITSYSDNGLTASTTYIYNVTALNASGESGASNEAIATTSGSVVTVPTAPTSLAATAVSSSQINLAWQDNSSNETGFRIRRRTGASGSWEVAGDVAAGVTAYQSTGLTAATTYYYSVTALNAAGESTLSNEANATTMSSGGGGGSSPTAPSNLKAIAASTSQVNLEWTDNSSDETGFEIRRKTGASGSWAVIATVGAGVTTYQNTGMTTGLSYSYTVNSVSAGGSSANSNTASVIVPLISFTGLTNGQAINDSVGRSASKYYRIYVPAGTSQLTVQTTGSGDVDIFVKSESQPTRTSFNCRAVSTGSNDRCVINAPAAGNWHVLIYGNFSGTSTYSLTGSY